ncbi:MAG: hypothetical protein HRT69_11610 [Flavobacteriaceae bacterium]|nr:hypothetical protein [Flavobacteriaceae bacterium]
MRKKIIYILLISLFFSCEKDQVTKETNIKFQYYGKWRKTFIISSYYYIFHDQNSSEDWEWQGESLSGYPKRDNDDCWLSDYGIINRCNTPGLSSSCINFNEEDSFFEFIDLDKFKEISEYYSVELITNNLDNCILEKTLKLRKEEIGTFKYSQDSIEFNYEKIIYSSIDDSFVIDNQIDYTNYNYSTNEKIVKVSYKPVTETESFTMKHEIGYLSDDLSDNYWENLYFIDSISLYKVESE